MQHPDEGLIHAWLDGELDAAEAVRVEALVASDPAWAAAAAQARGLIAASARIVGALDRVPANVIPKAAAPRNAARRWTLRAAAALVLIGGSAIVLNRTATDAVVITIPVKEKVAEQPAPQPAAPSMPAKAPKEEKSSVLKKELDAPKQAVALQDKDAAPSAALIAGAAGFGRGERRAAAAPPADIAAAAPRAMAAQNAVAEAKTTRLPLSCFEQREPSDSAGRIIRLSAAALADSVRLEKFTVRGDTLAAVNGPLIAVRVRCPAF